MNFSININADEEGYTGRECPECKKYFKIKFGTGLPGDPGCHCPYCNHHGPHNEFWTQQQIQYAQSIALNKISGELLKSMKKMERKPKKNQLISIGIKVKGHPTPIAYYSEKELEEKIECEECTLKYAIYGAFGFCPDCGAHNSKQIVLANFDLILKMLDLATESEMNIKSKLIENALEDCISSFDGFARECCSGITKKLSFQNLQKANKKLLENHNMDISNGIIEDEWKFVLEQFQKRHLLAHKFGIIDHEYLQKTNTTLDKLGRKVSISESDVRQLIKYLQIISQNIYSAVTHSK